MPPLAQIPDWLTPLSTFGMGGICLAFLMWRDVRRDEREAARNLERDARMDDVVKALNHLTRALTLEVLTRPNVVQRAQDEARELSQVVGDR